MPIEWAWLSRSRSTAPVVKEISLTEGEAGYVLLFHGLTGCPAELAYIAYHLHHRMGYRVWCPRLVNHGQPLGVLARTRWQEIEDGARACFQRAREEAAAARLPLYVGGLSLGAILSLILAADYSPEISAAICLAPTLFYDGWNVPWTHRLIPLVSYTPIRYFAYFREESPYGLKDESLRQHVAQQFGAVSIRDADCSGDSGYAHFPVNLFCEIRHLFQKCMRRLARVTCPVQLVQSVHDDITGPRNSQFIHDNVRSRVKEIVLLENSYHLVAADLEREKVAANVSRFCRAVRQGG